MRSRNGCKDRDAILTILCASEDVRLRCSFYPCRFYAIVCHVMLRLCMACSSLAAAPAKLLHLIKSLTLRWRRAKVSALRKTAPCEY